MTTWNLNLTEQADTVLRTLAALDTDDPAVMAATLRAVADRLDPPKTPGPVYRRGTPAGDLALIAAAEARSLGPYSRDTEATRAALRAAGVTPVEPWMRRQAGGATEVRTYQHAVNDGNEIDTPAGRMTPSRIDVHFRDGRFERLVAVGTRRPMGKGAHVEAEWTPDTVSGPKPLPGDWRGLIEPPTYAHDPDCNTLHDGPDPCPPPVTVEDRYRDGYDRDAFPDGLPTEADRWARSLVTPAAAEAVARIDADRNRVRITPDGCGPEHTFTGSCALTPPHRD